MFVFITVLEYAYVLFMMRRVKQNAMSKDNKAKAKKKASISVVPTTANSDMPPVDVVNHVNGFGPIKPDKKELLR